MARADNDGSALGHANGRRPVDASHSNSCGNCFILWWFIQPRRIHCCQGTFLPRLPTLQRGAAGPGAVSLNMIMILIALPHVYLAHQFQLLPDSHQLCPSSALPLPPHDVKLRPLPNSIGVHTPWMLAQSPRTASPPSRWTFLPLVLRIAAPRTIGRFEGEIIQYYIWPVGSPDRMWLIVIEWFRG